MPAARAIRADAPLSSFSIAPSGSEVAAACPDGRIRVWSVEDGRLLRSWAPGDPPTPFLLYLGDRLIAAGSPGRAVLLDAASGARLASWPTPALTEASAAVDGALLAGAGADGKVRLWKPDGTLARTLAAPGLSEITAVAVAPGGRRIAVGAADADLRVFDAASGALERVIDLTMAPFALDFSTDGRSLAAGCADGRVMLWDAATGEPGASPGRHALAVQAVCFSPDGKRLASATASVNPATAEAEARVFDRTLGTELSTPLGVSRWNAIGFAPSGRPFLVDVHAETLSIRDLAS